MGSTVSVADQNSDFMTMSFSIFFITLLFTITVDGKGPLPDYMLGKFQLEASEGMSDFMYKMGVGWFQRSIACTLYPTNTIRQSEDGEITQEMGSTFKTNKDVFRLNTPFQSRNELGSGKPATVLTKLKGNKLVRTVKKGDLDLVFVTEYSSDGNKMTITGTIEQDPTIKAVRGFTRIA